MEETNNEKSSESEKQKVKRNFVYTDARKEAFLKCVEARKKAIQLKKELKDEFKTDLKNKVKEKMKETKLPPIVQTPEKTTKKIVKNNEKEKISKVDKEEKQSKKRKIEQKESKKQMKKMEPTKKSVTIKKEEDDFSIGDNSENSDSESDIDVSSESDIEPQMYDKAKERQRELKIANDVRSRLQQSFQKLHGNSSQLQQKQNLQFL